jgi:P22_AR N-terminal domain/ORF6C domain
MKGEVTVAIMAMVALSTIMDRYEKAIEPVGERVVDFYGDPVPVAQVEGGEILVPLRPLTSFLGLDYSAQYRRVSRSEVMADSVRSVMMRSEDGSMRSQLCLPLDMLPGWLMGLDTNRIKPDLKEKLLRYQREAFKVLWNAFKGDIMPAVPPPVDLTPAQQMLAQAEAVAGIARQQVELERRQNDMANFMRPYVQKTSRQLADHEQRLVSLELRLDPEANITDEQAAELALAVKNVAYAMAGDSPSYGKVYSELYRRYRISGYKNLKRKDFDAALAWLGQWYEEIEKKKGQTS